MQASAVSAANRSSISLGIYSFAVISPLLWAGNFAIGRVLHQAVPPLTLNCLRWLTALIILLPLFGRSAWRARKELTQKWKAVGLLALTGVMGFNSVLYFGLRQTTALSASMIFSTTPMIILLMASFIDRASVSFVQLGGVMISVGGALLVLGGNFSQFGLGVFLQGDMVVVLACFIWACYCVLIKTCRFNADGGAVILASVIMGLVFQIPLSGAEILVFGLPQIEPSSLLAVAYLGIGAAAIAFLIWQRAVKDLGPARCGVFLNLIPVFAAVIAVIFLRETMHLHHLLGGICVALGIALAQNNASIFAGRWRTPIRALEPDK
jgi:drug/metabolite transporter (DMT)-like permease